MRKQQFADIAWYPAVLRADFEPWLLSPEIWVNLMRIRVRQRERVLFRSLRRKLAGMDAYGVTSTRATTSSLTRNRYSTVAD